MASTVSPTWTEPVLPSVAGFFPDTPEALMTARSVAGSRPTMVAEAVEPSVNLTLMVPAPSAAASTTWLLVTIVPSERRMTPEPVSPPWPASTVIETTLGETAAATLARFSVGAEEPPTFTGDCEVTTVFVPLSPAITAPVTPLPMATATRTAPAAARRPHGGPGRRGAPLVVRRRAGGGCAAAAKRLGGIGRRLVRGSAVGGRACAHTDCGSGLTCVAQSAAVQPAAGRSSSAVRPADRSNSCLVVSGRALQHSCNRPVSSLWPSALVSQVIHSTLEVPPQPSRRC